MNPLGRCLPPLAFPFRVSFPFGLILIESAQTVLIADTFTASMTRRDFGFWFSFLLCDVVQHRNGDSLHDFPIHA